MSDPIARAFPARPLRVTAPISVWRAWIGGIVGFLLFAGVMVMMSIEVLPVLSSDYRIRETAVSLPKTRVEGGTCRVRFFLLNDCEATLVIPQDRGPALRRKVGYVFFEPGAGVRNVMPMGDPAHPELTSTDLGLERFVNRVVTYAVLMAAMLALCLAMLLVPAALRRQKRILDQMSNQVFNPVPARLVRARQEWIVSPIAGGTASKWNLGTKGEPFVVDHRAGIVLAVTGAAGGALFPLDEKLTWIDVTDDERRVIWAARAEIQRSAQGSAG
ncbi:hypothetical protein [Roseococcus sp.]|uniref:hypothetical protein n=1 Tax=Roseococcus sp. TaxID=2109646 RepID=UPI003BA8D7CB